MEPTEAVWTITLDGEADETFERLLGELSKYIIQVETIEGISFDAVLLDAHTFQPTDEDGNTIGGPQELNRVAAVHVY